MYRHYPVILLLLLSGCAVTGGWQQVRQGEAVDLYYRAHPDSPIPRFRAVVSIDASRAAVMSVLTDFGSWPEWLYRCESAEIIGTRGYREAWIYQVTDLPVVRNRDVIMHATISTNVGEDDVVIEARTAPEYCDSAEADGRSVCREIRNANHVRVAALSGRFRIRSLEGGQVQVVWEQHIDPGGMLPDWLVRMMLDDLPMRSLRRLKQIVEREG